jgi:hypothetical protein
MNYMRLIIATAQDPINYAIGIYTLKSASQGGASAIIIDTPPITP